MTNNNFVHLHVHTQYSLLDGACQLKKLVDKAVEFGMPALAITDHGNIYGAVKFYDLCKKAGIKPIIGCETYVAPDSRFNKNYKPGQSNNNHLVLFAKNTQGYHNLIKLTSLASLEGFYYKPRVDKELLVKYSDGLIASSACLKGEIAAAIVAGQVDDAYKLADEYLNIFGKGNFYLEIMDNGIPEQAKVNQTLIAISKDLSIPLIATNDVHYLTREDSLAHEVLLCIQTQTTLNDPNRFKFSSDTFYLRSPAEMAQIFRDTPSAISNTVELADKCSFDFDFSKTYLPEFSLPADETADGYLTKLANDNLSSRYDVITDEIKERVEYELSVIKKTGFSGYFLIVWDLIRYAREVKIPVGPGRGSAAGSIVSYLLGITDIDPLKYKLLFERFLNPARISMPDIDMDFCYERRPEMLEYVAKKYGNDCVALIITFGSMLARAVIRDVGRAMGFSYGEIDKIAKMIQNTPGAQATLKEAIEINPDLASIYKTDSGIKRVIDIAIRLEGLSRHASTHAAGVVISDRPVMDRVPVIKGSDNEQIAAYDMTDIEKCGMLKMDFLGLKTLTLIDETVKIIKRTRKIDIDISKIRLDDEKTFELFGRGDTIGVFQLESRGMREILIKMQPARFEDIIAVLALYRPGPLGSGMVEDFILRKQGQKPIAYPHPKLEGILKETYGVILYQEQTMQIVAILAGFDMSQADTLRKAIGKKNAAIMARQREEFLVGTKKNGIAPKQAEQIFDLIEYFGGYGFNKSHSAAYALISYQTAYLKANFPVEFMAAVLTSERTDTNKIVQYINELRYLKIKLLPPDINTSYANFTVIDDNTIRFGLMAIKNVGGAALATILDERMNGKYADFFEFCDRMPARTVNKKVMESLIKSGAMDSFKLRRSQMFAMLDSVLARSNKKIDPNQLMFFEPTVKQPIPDIPEWPLVELLRHEKMLLGIYVTGHPLETYKMLTGRLARRKVNALLDSTYSGEVTICGVIDKAKMLLTKRNNSRMAILSIEDETGTIETVVFPRLFEDKGFLIAEGVIVVIRGKADRKDQVLKILAEDIIPIEQLKTKLKEVSITIPKDKELLTKLKAVISDANGGGTVPVIFSLKDKGMMGIRIKTNDKFLLDPTEEKLTRICELVGTQNLRLIL